MTDPIHRPVSSEDEVYGSEGPPQTNVKVAKEQRAAEWERRRDQEKADLSEVLNTEAGQAVLCRLLDFCEVYQSTIKFGHADASAFAEGKRAVGLWLIKAMCSIDPLVYAEVLKRHAKRSRQKAGAEAAAERLAAASMPTPRPGVP